MGKPLLLALVLAASSSVAAANEGRDHLVAAIGEQLGADSLWRIAWRKDGHVIRWVARVDGSRSGLREGQLPVRAFRGLAPSGAALFDPPTWSYIPRRTASWQKQALDSAVAVRHEASPEALQRLFEGPTVVHPVEPPAKDGPTFLPARQARAKVQRYLAAETGTTGWRVKLLHPVEDELPRWQATRKGQPARTGSIYTGPRPGRGTVIPDRTARPR